MSNPSGRRDTASAMTSRSEEHTSELQSQSNLVCRLLLEKKKENDDRTHCSPDRGPSTDRVLFFSGAGGVLVRGGVALSRRGRNGSVTVLLFDHARDVAGDECSHTQRCDVGLCREA